MRLLIVSDLHIWGPEDPLYRSFLELIRQTVSGDELVLAGDLFDLFVGNKAFFVERYSAFFQALREAGERNVKTHYIEGNHDFLIRGAFRGIPGFALHSREVTFQENGKRFYVSHGDLADRKDYGYRALRLLFRSPLMKAFVTSMPGRAIDGIGQWMSSKSRGRKPLLPAHLPSERIEALRKVYRNHAVEKLTQGFDYVVMGHCHDLDEMRFKIGDREGQYWNVGYPRTHGTYLVWESNEGMARTRLP